MPLTSPITSLFSGSTTTRPSNNNNEFGIVDDGLSGGKPYLAHVKLGTAANLRTDTMELAEVEEEARPPYLHVRKCSIFFLYLRKKLTDTVYSA